MPHSPIATITTERHVDAPAAIDLNDLKSRSVRGGTITFISQAAIISIGAISTVILARLLTPDDYGVIAMISALTSFAGLFRDFGLSSATIQRHTLTPAQQSNLFWVNVALGLLLTCAVASSSPLVSAFYGQPELVWPTASLAAIFFINSLAAQSAALLARDMRFGTQALAAVCGALTTLATAVGFAIYDFHYWALVLGQLSGAAVSSCLLFFLSPFRPTLPRRHTGLTDMFLFGGQITTFNFVNYFQRNLDNILIGRYYGATPLGLYSRAYTLLLFPITNLRTPITSVAFPALSRLQHQPLLYRAYYLRVTSLLAFISMPLISYLFVAATPLIQLTLGPQWLGVAPIFSYLAIAAFIQPSTSFIGSVLLSLGRGRRYLECGFFNALVLSASFIIGLPWGPKGVALSYAVANYVALYPWATWALRASPVSFRDFCQACAFPVAASLAAGTVAFILNAHLTTARPVVRLCLISLAFLAAMALTTSLTTRGRRNVMFIMSVLTPAYISLKSRLTPAVAARDSNHP
jgi:PST family polysaccharide transporter